MFQNIFYQKRGGNDNGIIHLWDDEEGYLQFPYEPYCYVETKDGEYRSMFGQNLSKLNHIPSSKKELWESDVSPVTRTLIDLYLDDDNVSKNHIIMNFDIEVDITDGFPNIEFAENEITSIGVKYSNSEKYIVYILDKKNQIQNKSTDNCLILSFMTEESLLEAFLKHYTKVKPTIWTGWNILKFDSPYLYNRMKRVLGKTTAKTLSPISIARINPYKDALEVAGISQLDYLYLYKQFTYSEMPNYRLDTVGKKEVSMGKIEYEGSLQRLYETDLDKFILYNLTDVMIVEKINEKMKLIDLVQAICHTCHVPYEDIQFSSSFLEGALLVYLRKNNLVAPNKPEKINLSENDKFAGAYVKSPDCGLHKWVFSCDINSLYPNAIMTLNISPETKIGRIFCEGKKSINFYDCVKSKEELVFRNDRTNKTDTFQPKELVDYLKKNNYAVSSAGVVYEDKEKHLGLIPTILDIWYKERKEFKKKMYKASDENNDSEYQFYKKRQHVQKILLNSLYGVLGLDGWRWFDIENAESVTLSGQDIIKTTGKFINSTYKKMIDESTKTENDYVIYTDTDSAYVSAEKILDHKNIKEEDRKQHTIDLSRKFVDDTNIFYSTMCKNLFNCKTHTIQIAGETIASSGLFIKKKKYALLKVYDMELEKDISKVEVKGLDTIRSNFPAIFKNLMAEILNDILNDTEKTKIDEKILDFKLKINEFHYDEISNNTAVKEISSKYEKHCITNDCVLGQFPLVKKEDGNTMAYPAQIKAAINYNMLLKHFGLNKKHVPIRDGDKIKWTYLKKNSFGLEELAYTNDNDPDEILNIIDKYIDRDKMYENNFCSKVININKIKIKNGEEEGVKSFYQVLGWDKPSESKRTAEQFFSF